MTKKLNLASADVSMRLRAGLILLRCFTPISVFTCIFWDKRHQIEEFCEMLHHFCWTGAQTLSDARRVLRLCNCRFVWVWVPEHLTENQDTSPLCLCFPAAELRLFTLPLSVSLRSFSLPSIFYTSIKDGWQTANQDRFHWKCAENIAENIPENVGEVDV